MFGDTLGFVQHRGGDLEQAAS